MKARILTINAGQAGLTSTLFDTDGEILASEYASYEAERPAGGWVQQPVERYFDAMRDTVGRIVAQEGGKGVVSIGLTGVMNGCIPVDTVGAPLHPNILPTDIRALDHLNDLRAAITEREYYQRTGSRFDARSCLAKMLWLRDCAPGVYARTRWFVQSKDVLYAFLTGRQGISDYTDASLTGALHITEARWDESLFHALGLDVARMPQLRVSHDMEGHLTRKAARVLGLTGGIPVTVGAGDGACAAHGAGLPETVGAYCSLGSGTWMAALSKLPLLDSAMRVHNYFDMDGRQYNVRCAAQIGSGVLDWAARHLLFGGKKLGGEEYEALEALAGSAEAGARGVFFVPSTTAEQAPWLETGVRGTLVGLSMRHTPGDIARALYEGVAQTARLCADVLLEGGVRFDKLAMIGAGAQSAVWPQMLADMFGRPILVHKVPRTAVSLGAAMAAGVGVELYFDYGDATRIAAFEPERAPAPERQAFYEPYGTLYRSLAGQLQGVCQQIHRSQLDLFRETEDEPEAPPLQAPDQQPEDPPPRRPAPAGGQGGGALEPQALRPEGGAQGGLPRDGGEEASGNLSEASPFGGAAGGGVPAPPSPAPPGGDPPSS